jgi:hypothetical protein
LSIFSFSQVLALYTWFPLVVVLAIFLLIARFYQRFSSQRTFYWFFVLPVLFYGAAAVRYAGADSISGDVLGDLYGAVGGIILLGLVIQLYLKMTSDKSGL